MNYGPDWTPPWAAGQPLARCRGRDCTWEGTPNLLVVASTLDAQGLCAQCARTPNGENRQLPQEESQAIEERIVVSTPSTDVEQLRLDLA